MSDINSILNKLLKFYDLDTLSELSEVLKVSQPTISKWRARNTIIPIKKRCRELGIYNEIFGDFKEEIFKDLEYSDFDKIKTLKQQCKKYDIQTTTIKNLRLLYLFQELEKYSNENLEKSLKDLLLNSNPLFNGLDENSKNIISENLEKNIKIFEKENL